MPPPAPTADGGTVLRVEVADTGVGIDGDDDRRSSSTPSPRPTRRRRGCTAAPGSAWPSRARSSTPSAARSALEPNAGGGSVFWFTATFDEPTGSAADPDDEYARTWLRGRRVLVVDDNEHNRLILEEQLAWWQVRSVGVGRRRRGRAALAGARRGGRPVRRRAPRPGRCRGATASTSPRTCAATRRTTTSRC